MRLSVQNGDGDSTILVVDDDLDVRVTVAEALTESGYVVRTAENGLDAIAVINEGVRPCLIVLDMWMPVMDGYQFMDRLNEDPDLATIPVLILTAADALKRVGMGEVGVIRKPFPIEALLAMAGRFCTGGEVL